MPSIANMDISNSTFASLPLLSPSPPPSSQFDLRTPALVSAALAVLICVGFAGYLCTKVINVTNLKCYRRNGHKSTQKDETKPTGTEVSGSSEVGDVDIEAQAHKVVSNELVADEVEVELKKRYDGKDDVGATPGLDANPGNVKEAAQQAPALPELSDTKVKEDDIIGKPFSRLPPCYPATEDEESIIGIPEMALHKAIVKPSSSKVRNVGARKHTTAFAVIEVKPCFAVTEEICLPTFQPVEESTDESKEPAIIANSSPSNSACTKISRGKARSGAVTPKSLLGRRPLAAAGPHSTPSARGRPLPISGNAKPVVSARSAKGTLTKAGPTGRPSPLTPGPRIASRRAPRIPSAQDSAPCSAKENIKSAVPNSATRVWKN